MEKSILAAKERKVITKASRNKLRVEGKVPGVYYSRHGKPIALEVTEAAIKPLVFTAETKLISLKLEGMEDSDCIIKDVQFDPVTDRVIHIDLQGLTSGEKFQLEVPVALHGSPIGVKEGGIVQHIMHRVEIECLPKDIPQHIDLDISNLKIGDSIHVKDLSLENITVLTSPESVIVLVAHPKVEKEAPVEAEEEIPTEPEVIGKGKPEEEEEE